MKPTIGRVVHYCVTAEDAEEINRLRINGVRIASIPYPLPLGTQWHIGNPVKEGMIFPAMITRVWGPDEHSAVQLQVFLDGNDTFWATSVVVGKGPRTFSWPARD